MTVPLTNLANAQTINVTLNALDKRSDPMSVLIGDTNANGTVNAADVAQTKSRLGQTFDATNFRSDVNANGSINAAGYGYCETAQWHFVAAVMKSLIERLPSMGPSLRQVRLGAQARSVAYLAEWQKGVK